MKFTIALHKNALPVDYCVLDAALNHRDVGGFRYLYLRSRLLSVNEILYLRYEGICE